MHNTGTASVNLPAASSASGQCALEDELRQMQSYTDHIGPPGPKGLGTCIKLGAVWVSGSEANWCKHRCKILLTKD